VEKSFHNFPVGCRVNRRLLFPVWQGKEQRGDAEEEEKKSFRVGGSEVVSGSQSMGSFLIQASVKRGLIWREVILLKSGNGQILLKGDGGKKKSELRKWQRGQTDSLSIL